MSSAFNAGKSEVSQKEYDDFNESVKSLNILMDVQGYSRKVILGLEKGERIISFVPISSPITIKIEINKAYWEHFFNTFAPFARAKEFT